MYFCISVNTIAVAKPEKAQMVESMLIQMAQSGQIQRERERDRENAVSEMYFCFSVNTIAVAKPEKAQMVESMLIQMAQSGQIQGKV